MGPNESYMIQGSQIIWAPLVPQKTEFDWSTSYMGATAVSRFPLHQRMSGQING